MFHQNSLPVSQQLYHNGDISFAQDFGGDFHLRVLVATKVRPFGGGGPFFCPNDGSFYHWAVGIVQYRTKNKLTEVLIWI